MSIEDIKQLMDGFDPASLLPNLDTMLGKTAFLMRILVLLGPIILLALGVAYLLVSPREANYHFGYRCYFGMGSEEAWRFTQRIAGLVWGGLGLVLTVVMLLISGSFGKLEPMDMVWKAGWCGVWEAVLIALACIGINITVAAFFDRSSRRKR